MNNIFTPPVFTDDKDTQIARLLYVFLWTLILAVSVMMFAVFLLPEITGNLLLLIGTVDATSMLLLVLTRRGHTKLVSWMVILQMWVITTSILSAGGGIHNPAVILYLTIVLMAGLTLGQRVGIATAGFCLFTQLILVYAEQADLLLPSMIKHNALTILIFNTWAMIIIAALQYFAASTVSELFERLARQLKDRQKTEKSLMVSEEKYRLILDNIDDGYYEVDLDGNFTFFNDAIPVFMGYTHEELMNKGFKAVIDEDNAKTVFETFRQVYQTGVPKRLVEWGINRKDGSKAYMESSVFLIKDADDNPVGFRGVSRDITERKKFQEKIRVKAATDELTGLSNRQSFISLVEQQLKIADQTKRSGMLTLMHINNLKQIIDMRGQTEGNKVVFNMVNILKMIFRKSDIIARVREDEFAVYAPEVTDTMHDIFYGRLRYHFKAISSQEDRGYKLSMSAGSTFYEPDNPCSVDLLISKAGKVMIEDNRHTVSMG